MSKEIRGARPITPGDLINDSDILHRTKYLVTNQLEIPSHVYRAYLRLKERSGNWRTASNEEILCILEDVPHSWDLPTRFDRVPRPHPESAYHDFVHRINRSENDFMSFDSDSGSTRFLAMTRDARNPDTGSFYQRLRQANITIKNVLLFASPPLVVREKHRLSESAIKAVEEEETRAKAAREALDKENEALAEENKTPDNDKKIPSYHLLPVKDSDHHARYGPWLIKDRRDNFASDIARFLSKNPDNRSSNVLQASFDVPPYAGHDKEEYIRKGVMKVNSSTFLFDTTLNSGLLQAVQECGFMPAVIMTYFTFWRDGRDQDQNALDNVYAMDYRITHWLTEYYDVFHRGNGNGFVTCDPTIYIRKPMPLMQWVKDHVAGDKPRYTGPK